MMGLERLAAEIAGGALLCALFVGWWVYHDHAEQRVGASACIAATTVVKAEVVTENSGIEAAHAAQVTQVVAVYEQKLLDASHTNADLAQRMHDYAVREVAVSHSRCAATPGNADRGLPASEGSAGPGLGRLGDDTRAVLDACDADHAKVTMDVGAYNDWRQRMIDLAKQP